MESERQLSKARTNGAFRMAQKGGRAIRPEEIRRTEARYRARRLRDASEAVKLGVSDEFLQSVGVRYIAGDSE